MKLTLTTTLAAVAIVAASASLFAADNVVITGTPKSPPNSAYQRSMNACIDEFLGKILPGNSVRVRTVILPSNGYEFSSSGPFHHFQMNVEMTAYSTPGHVLLAEWVCKVDRTATVLSLFVHSGDSAKLAGLTPKDVMLAVVNR